MSTLSEDLEKLDRLLESLEKNQAELRRLKERSDASLERFHELVQEMLEAKPDTSRPRPRGILDRLFYFSCP